MALTKCGADVRVISGLEDSPKLTAVELKARFDSAGVAIKEYLNDNLTEEIDESLRALEDKTGNIPSVVDALDSVDTKAALSAAQGKALNENKQNKITLGTTAPSGGSDGDLYIWY